MNRWEGKNQADYTEASWAALTEKLTTAKAALEAKESQEAVDAAQTALDAAVAALEAKPSEPEKPDVTTGTYVPGKRLSEVVGEFVDESKTPVAVWVGPGHPQDYVRGIPNCMVIDSNNHDIKEKLVNEFTSDLIRFYLGTDLIGSEIGAASKNVIGIAAGMLDGLNYTSLKGALMARGTREIARLIKALGGNEMSAYGLCHLGDYEATLFSKWSHNRMYGESFAKGDRFTKLAEGVMTSKALYKLGQEYGVDLPIVESVYKVLFDGTDIKEALGTLFMRSVKKEF